ncbi:MAG: dihydroneopterin aldolase [Flavobacteriales bacterium]|nr:dihydroneopterin aldolase [Flavobacteriales bacterium]
MGLIELNNIRIFSNHGCMEEELKIGSEYRIDLTAQTDLKKSSYSDKLDDTVNYVLLNTIVKEEMAIRSKLLEHVAQRILTRIKSELPKINAAKVRICKINPPVNGNVESVCIVMEF